MKTIYDPRYRRVINRIKTQRLASCISQKEAGLRIQKSRQWIAKIEMHELRLDILNFVQLCRAYKLKPSDLIKSLEEESSEDDFSLAIRMCCLMLHLGACFAEFFPSVLPNISFYR